ncbi:hypothetical protein RB195_012020 [Necator americanus]|uniref:Uncharacterized protein n=1 Tax=Necator americanus TaxID=51031 RepID=A0ABR1D557_NECAM
MTSFTRIVSWAKRRWCSCQPSTFTLMSNRSNTRIAFSKVALRILDSSCELFGFKEHVHYHTRVGKYSDSANSSDAGYS